MAASLKDQLAAAKARIVELEAQLADAELALTGQAPAQPSTEPDAGTPVWVQDTSGRLWEVEAGSTTYRNLRDQGGVLVDAPAAE